MTVEALLKELADGHFHSGDELGETLGVSRTAIWKQIKKIDGLGLSLESVKGKGYRLPGGLDLLCEKTILDGLSELTKPLISELNVESIIDSTNTIAMSKAKDGVSGYVCTAEHQLAGKGRRGRHWQGSYGGGISLSIVWEFSGGVASLEGLSLAVGVGVVEALTKAGLTGAQLKWPNDVLYEGKKLSGVLLEVVGDADGLCRVVVGIGLNVMTSKHTMRDVEQPWTDVKSITEKEISRNQLLSLILNEQIEMLSSFEEKGFTAYRDQWLALDAFRGKEVLITHGSNVIEGIALGVDITGAAILDTDSGQKVFSGGEVSLKIK